MYRRLNQSKLLSFKYRINILFLNLIINIGLDSQSKYIDSLSKCIDSQSKCIDSQSKYRFSI